MRLVHDEQIPGPRGRCAPNERTNRGSEQMRVAFLVEAAKALFVGQREVFGEVLA